MSITFIGALANNWGNVGPTYSCAIGYDPGDGTVNMIGYNFAPATDFTEATNLQDEQHLVTIDSPNSSDRYTRYPRVSQGDWQGGGKQLIYENANQFYYSDGWETATPGLLYPSPTSQAVAGTIGTPGSPPSFPVVTDGSVWIIGTYLTSASHNCIIGSDAHPLGVAASIGHSGTVNPEIYSFLRSPLGIFAATADGIFLVNTTTPTSSTLWTTDVCTNLNYFNMAYFNENLYYIKSTGDIYSGNDGSGLPFTPSSVATHPSMEQPYIALCSTADGLFWATGSGGQATVPASNAAVLYTYNGTTISRLAELQGYIKGCMELNGTTYILAVLDQSSGNGAYTLYASTGPGSLSIVADTRYDAPDFQAPDSILPLTEYFKAGMSQDGRYLYIGWQGLHGLRYDPILNATSFVGAPGPVETKQDSRVIVNTAASGLIDVYANANHSIYQALAYRTIPPGNSGPFETSYFDFGVPTVNKLFLGIDINMSTVQLPNSIHVNFRVDNAVNWTAANVYTQGSGTWIRVSLPSGTIGGRIQFQILYIGVESDWPWQIVDYSVRGELGRIWQMTVSCRRYSQQDSAPYDDPQGLSGIELWANLYNARRIAGGDIYLWITDPTDPGGDETYVAQILRAHIEDMTITSSAGIPSGARVPNSAVAGFDAERDITLQLVEDLSEA